VRVDILYAHLQDITVVVGQQVNAGDLIGHIGTTGVSTGCHLHFEIRIDGVPIDPNQFLNITCICP